MARTKAIVGLMIGVMIATVLFLPLVTTVNANSGTQAVTNETVTVYNDSWTELQGYSLDESSVTVYGYNDTADSYEQAASDEYNLDAEAGEIQVNGSSSDGVIEDGEEVKVSYDYEATSGMTTAIITLVPLLGAVVIVGTMGLKLQGMM